jgi:hypothetical protein
MGWRPLTPAEGHHCPDNGGGQQECGDLDPGRQIRQPPLSCPGDEAVDRLLGVASA